MTSDPDNFVSFGKVSVFVALFATLPVSLYRLAEINGQFCSYKYFMRSQSHVKMSNLAQSFVG
jgi:hypothetical protein